MENRNSCRWCEKAGATPKLSAEECRLLHVEFPLALSTEEMRVHWEAHQQVIEPLLIRMGAENAKLDSVARTVLVGTLGGIRARLAMIPMLGRSALQIVEKYGLRQLVYRLAGEFSLMELSAAAGYRTFCFPDLVKGLLKTGKMRDNSVARFIDTFEFLKVMMQQPFDDPVVLSQLDRTNGLHGKYKVAGAQNRHAQDLFKYIALNMFYIGPSMRPDLTVQERHAIMGLTVLVAQRMGHTIGGSVAELEEFIQRYEAEQMFDRADDGVLRRRAIEIAKASKKALDHIPTISPARIHGYVPHRVKEILDIV